ncbi:unnamed protein product [Sphenostylis stenocarpa]|uniref:Uncharacterized protein n=1 Tax=Sphenostylis stenocarpa TaxID=92480 RepID=A0AA86SKH0_9FABA|nr:unnamed protein product [Sphenostylis stenocarpa]
MASPADLRVIGSEGFALIDKFYGPSARRRPNPKGVFPARQGRWVVQVPNDELEEPAINSREAASRYEDMKPELDKRYDFRQAKHWRKVAIRETIFVMYRKKVAIQQRRDLFR